MPVRIKVTSRQLPDGRHVTDAITPEFFLEPGTPRRPRPPERVTCPLFPQHLFNPIRNSLHQTWHRVWPRLSTILSALVLLALGALALKVLLTILLCKPLNWPLSQR
jgi:hypothetical protein